MVPLYAWRHWNHSLGNLLHLIRDDITNHLLSAYIMYTCTDSVFEIHLSESVEWFIENQPFSLLCNLAPSPPLPSSPVSKLAPFLSLPVGRRSSFPKGVGDGGGAKSYYGEEAWSPVNNSILSAVNTLLPKNKLTKWGKCFRHDFNGRVHNNYYFIQRN